MPILIKRLSEEEKQQYDFRSVVPALEPLLKEITQELKSYREGEIGQVEPDGSTVRATRRRLGIAAKRVGVRLEWAKGDELVFRVRKLRKARSS